MTDLQRVDVDEIHASSLSTSAPRIVRDSAVTYLVGGRRYCIRTEPKCHTCRSHHRVEIEQGLLKGWSYNTILGSLPAGHGISEDSVGNHVRANHLPMDEALRRAMIEERARDIGLDVDNHRGTLVDHIAFARQGIQRTFERMAAGQIEPTIGEAIALSRLLMDAEEASGGDVDNQTYAEAFRVYVDVAQSIMSEEQFIAFGAALTEHPTMRALLGRKAVGAAPAQGSL